jgi:adenylate kinase family enzyme
MCYSIPSGETVDDRTTLATRVKAIGAGLVALDGCHGAGKTCLANWIGTTQNIKVIHTDDFLQPRTGAFVQALRMEEIRTAISEAHCETNVVILDGLCARDVLEQLGITASMFIYVQRTSEMGVPGDFRILDYECECEIWEPRVLEDELDRELADYHRRQKPRRWADILFIRTA